MSGSRFAHRFFFGFGNSAFFNLLRPISGGGFTRNFMKAVTYASTGTATVGVFNKFSDYRDGKATGKETALYSSAAFFGCLSGRNAFSALSYTAASGWLYFASLITRAEDWRDAHPQEQFIPDGVITTADQLDLFFPAITSVTGQVSELTGGKAGPIVKTLNLGWSMMNLDLAPAKRLLKDAGGEMEYAESVPPEQLPFKVASFGDQFLGDVEHIFITKTD